MSIFKQVSGKGKEIVLLHGWGGDHQFMQPLVETLESKYKVHTFDLPGRGKSDWQPNTETIHDFAKQLYSELPDEAIYTQRNSRCEYNKFIC